MLCFKKLRSLLCTGICPHIFLLAAVIALLQLFQNDLLFQRNAITNGSLWLIITGNLVHTNPYHLLMNLAGLSFICLLFKNYISVRLFYTSLLITTIFVGLGVYFYTELAWYAGLSGALYGLYMVAATRAALHKDYIISLPILIAIPVKLAWDSYYPDLTDSSALLIGAPVATDAHIYGLIAGVLISLVITFNAYLKPSKLSSK